MIKKIMAGINLAIVFFSKTALKLNFFLPLTLKMGFFFVSGKLIRRKSGMSGDFWDEWRRRKAKSHAIQEYLALIFNFGSSPN